MAASSGMTRRRGDQPGALASLAAPRSSARRPDPSRAAYPVKPAGELYAGSCSAPATRKRSDAQFNAALARTPRRAASLLGLARAASAAGQAKLAADTAREFLNVWKLADKDRPELAEARQLAR